MPQFTIPLEGGGEIRQNGATYADAVANARSAGATPAGQSGGSSGGGGQSNTGGGGGAAGGGGQSTSYQQLMQSAQGLPAPNQISPDAWNAYTTTQKQLLLSMYGGQGWAPQDVTDLYQKSLPKYTGLAGAGVMRVA